MNTKLVYVLTCSEQGSYIEQALMAVFSARHWNPDAHIVLIVDNLTDKLLSGRRAEILLYVSEKIVISFEDDSLSMTYRSRFIKTSVRRIIAGDFLFVDSDTITQRSISDIDSLQCEVGAVLESHLKVKEFCDALFNLHQKRARLIGVDLNEEEYYFSSGVIFVKDSFAAHNLYDKWFRFWNESCGKGLSVDQPALSKANREVAHIIERIPDVYNCVIFTQPQFTSEAYILHFSSYQNPSFLFTNKVLDYIRENGINNKWIKHSVLNPCSSFLPFDYQISHSTHKQRRKWRYDFSSFLKGYREFIDPSFEDFSMQSRLRPIVIWFLSNKMINTGVSIWFIWKQIHLALKGNTISDNICRK